MPSKNNPTDLPQVKAAQSTASINPVIDTASHHGSEHTGSFTEVVLRSDDAPQAIAAISDAVRKEIARIEQCVTHAQHRLGHFEMLYDTSSSEFAECFSAEDLRGGDLEYVEWMGEYQLFQHLLQNLTLLKSLTYVAE